MSSLRETLVCLQTELKGLLEKRPGLCFESGFLTKNFQLSFMRLPIITLSLFLLITQLSSADTYEATWDSLLNYEAPEWYEDAKLGYWVHWGVYSVPAFRGVHAAEWYGRWMYCKDGQAGKKEPGKYVQEYHIENYGPIEVFGYKDFIPMFKAEKFDPEFWADLCVEGGAKFFTMMATHHDSFLMWDSELSKWNAADMGPKRDLVGELAEAIRARGLKYGVSNHSAWNYAFFEWNHINGYDAKDPANQDLYGNPIIDPTIDNRDRSAPSQRDVDRWLARTIEVTDKYKPDLHYFDWGNRGGAFKELSPTFAAHYYNEAVKWGKGEHGSPGVVINFKKNAFVHGTAVYDFERRRAEKIEDMVWQTDDAVYTNSWGYSPGASIKSTDRIIDELMDIISKRGVLMLSFAPMADGSFPDDQIQLAQELGGWLKVHGEAVYATRPYQIYRDAPDLPKNEGKRGEFGVRYTRNKKNDTLYATALQWPGKHLTLQSLAKIDSSLVESVTHLGIDGELEWKMTPEGMRITMPNEPNNAFAYPIRIAFKTEIPAPAE